jgi:DNA mismatch repair ATPase MutS
MTTRSGAQERCSPTCNAGVQLDIFLGTQMRIGCSAFRRSRCSVSVTRCESYMRLHDESNTNNGRFINADTLHSLQILDDESHPNSHNQGPTKSASGSKEGLSVYGLFRHLARTPQGRLLLRRYFLRPSLDLDTINERLDAVQIFCRPENESPLAAIVESLKAVGNMRTMMAKLKKGVSGGSGKNTGPSGSAWASTRRVSSLRDPPLQQSRAEQD